MDKIQITGKRRKEKPITAVNHDNIITFKLRLK